MKFLVLSSERSFKMSQTYYDYGALEQLLEERERDLELAARIGQTLLEKNRQLADQVILIGYYILIFREMVVLISLRVVRGLNSCSGNLNPS